MKWVPFLIPILLLLSCAEQGQKNSQASQGSPHSLILWTPYNDSAEVLANQTHEIERMRFKLIQSRVLDKNEVFRPLYSEVSMLPDAAYHRMESLVLEQDIPSIQSHIAAGRLTYENLVLFYLHRIYRYELDNGTTLNTIIALNTEVLNEARQKDRLRQTEDQAGFHPIFGMPILIKDNIGTEGMKTTAGSIALKENDAPDAFIVAQLKQKGAIILGKVNLSEWAYYLCKGCPLGYSAIGGQTLNPYGRGIFETGGSSSGSATAVAANYAVAAVGTETSGSILSPSGQNSVVGLKPTVGLLSRGGIVPISGTLDTPGPMTKNVVDNAILLDAMMGYDRLDPASVPDPRESGWSPLQSDAPSLNGKRFGAFADLLESDSLYRTRVAQMKKAGALVVVLSPPEVQLNGFTSLLNIDMKHDLPKYLESTVKNRDAVKITSIADAVVFNDSDSLLRIPYGQAIFKDILADPMSDTELEILKDDLEKSGRSFFNDGLETYQLDAILSINNYHAGFAAVAKYPALTVPMGFRDSGEPVNLTFISQPFCEDQLYPLGMAFESLTVARKAPPGYP